jgi:hypothetical protein
LEVVRQNLQIRERGVATAQSLRLLVELPI